MSGDTSANVTDVKGWGTDSKGWDALATSSEFSAIWEVGHGLSGSYQPPSKQKSYIIVYMNYLTKWAEKNAIKAWTEEKIAKFLRENILYKFGYPRELATDQGSQFTSNLIEDLLTHHKIKHRTSTPYHP